MAAGSNKTLIGLLLLGGLAAVMMADDKPPTVEQKKKQLPGGGWNPQAMRTPGMTDFAALFKAVRKA